MNLEPTQAFVEPASILAILVLNAAVGVWQSRSAQDSLDALKKLQPDNACVVRDGELAAAHAPPVCCRFGFCFAIFCQSTGVRYLFSPVNRV